MTGILVGVDGSESAAEAVRWAARESELHDWPLTALLAWGYLDQHFADVDGGFDPEYSEDDARAALEAYLDRALGSARPKVELRTPCTLPASALVEEAARQDLLVVGARGHGALRSLLLGSVSRHCLHHAAGPIALVRPSPAGDTGRIVVGVDGSETSRLALHWAVEEARVRHARVEAVLTWHPPYVGGYPYTGGAIDAEVLEGTARSTLDEAVTSVDTSGLAQPIDSIVALGDPAAVLVDAAAGADLLVVGSRGLGGFAGVLLGSVGHHVAHHAACTVVVIPPRG